MRAILSVYDKTGLLELARGLAAQGVELFSTGGTHRTMEGAGLKVHAVEEITGFPEILDGRVKTLHPKVHGGLLGRRDLPAHVAQMQRLGITPIDLVVVNLYPFMATIANPNVTLEDALENIDIGGPTMLRAAAKNYLSVLVVCDPADYPAVGGALRAGSVDQAMRRRLAAKAFQHVAFYDTAIAGYLRDAADAFPEELTLAYKRQQSLRYGENPHQSAAFYVDGTVREHQRGGIATAAQHHGKEMSYNNYLDADAAWNAVNDFTGPTCVIVKHTNPCGVATRADLLEAYRLAVQADATSAFGGIVAFNRPVDGALARELREFRSPIDSESRMFYEIVIAPSYTSEGLKVLQGKSKDLRILEAKPLQPGGRAFRQVGGGALVQDADDRTPEEIEFKVVTQRQPTAQEMEDVKFAWRCVKHVKSNAITIAKDGRLLGMGSGQPNRVKSVEIAMGKSGEEIKGAALASDAFFPFAWGDSIEHACQAGVAVIAHPGGSLRDQDGIDCCNKYGVAMVLTGTRHFRH
ncbi:MAG: bifunctional phosphoribosylaminoimidazolecarboxamide formyltransferase/IMP cyclohydrolase [Dehalococcoidia bacterium]|nr:bifunctional phosphoribosylaminoimidazolecarboxamide formyltransferase/IMP cyclohydrolase [Dehalococcoidia bacterium]